MKRKKNSTKKYFTPAEANAMLPLVRSIVGDITALAKVMAERYEPLLNGKKGAGTAHETEALEEELERDKAKFYEYANELTKLGVQLKDMESGLVDFPCWMDDREVNLCWRSDESAVAHWHEVDAGFSGRQPLNDHALQKTKAVNE